MNDDGRQQAFMSALVTEHFVLQSAPGATISEASGRAAWSPRSMARWARRRRMGDGGGRAGLAPRRAGFTPTTRIRIFTVYLADQDKHGGSTSRSFTAIVTAVATLPSASEP
jgi:hypothetical protein